VSAESDPLATVRLSVAELRWRCAPEDLGFETTADVEAVVGVVGQDEAMEALRFGLEFDAPGQNVFVRAVLGTGRVTMIESVLEQVAPERPPGPDHCYVHNFEDPDRPRLITLESGTGDAFRDRMGEFVRFVVEDLGPALDDDELRSAQAEIEEQARAELDGLAKPFDEELAEQGLGLMMAQVGNVMRPIIVPRIDGEPIPPTQLKALHEAGKLDDAAIKELGERAEVYSERLEQIGREFLALQQRRRDRLRQAVGNTARALLKAATADIGEVFGEAVENWVDEVIGDALDHAVPEPDEGLEPERRYAVNVISGHRRSEGAPVILENTPSVPSLLGSIAPDVLGERELRADHMSVHAGSLLRADRGFLVLDARDLLVAPGAWRVLIRTLRSGQLDIAPGDGPTTLRAPMLRPQPVPIDVKVILVGDPSIYYLLDAKDDDFRNLFKVISDVDSTMANGPQAVEMYAGVLAKLVAEEGLPHFTAAAVAALAEHGARISDRQDRLTARFGRVADLAREAAFLSRANGERVESAHVIEAVARTKRRAGRPARRFVEMIARGSIRIRSTGAVVGQINGLAVSRAGPLTYGFPVRITATASPGTNGVVNIEREADLSGAIHTKSFIIIGGLLRSMLELDHPLPLDAGIAFEQSYGGIDGDSASVAMFIALLSALSDVPVRQDIAVTGALDQHGWVLPVGGTNEKIEGFFDVVSASGFEGEPGVAIPRSNASDLMLRHDLVGTADRGQFAVFAMTRIEEAIRLLMVVPEDADPVSAVLDRARARAGAFWSASRPA
jgi:ATP-dependent Lon protease